MVVEFLPANYAGADNFRTGGVGEAVHGAAGVDHAQAVGFAKGAGGIGGVAEMVVDYAFDDKQAIAGDAAGVAFEAFKAAGVVFAVFVAFGVGVGFVKVGIGEKVADLVDAVPFVRGAGDDDDVFQAGFLQAGDVGFRAEFVAGGGIVGEKVAVDGAVVVAFPLADDVGIVAAGKSGVLVPVQPEDAGAIELQEPDGCEVAHADVPKCVEWPAGVEGEVEQAVFGVDVHHPGAIDGVVACGLECLAGEGGEFLEHGMPLLLFLGAVPAFLGMGERAEWEIVAGAKLGQLGIDLGEVFDGFAAEWFAVVDLVNGIKKPGVKVKTEIDGGEFGGVVLHCGLQEFIVQAQLAAFVSGLDGDKVSGGDGVQGAGFDFLGLAGGEDGCFAKLGNVKARGGVAAQGCSRVGP